jgi:hypothetical protein
MTTNNLNTSVPWYCLIQNGIYLHIMCGLENLQLNKVLDFESLIGFWCQ